MQNATLSSSFFEESRIKALSLQKEGETGTKRLADLDKLFRKAFEEMTLEHLSNQQFQMLTQGYEVENRICPSVWGFLKPKMPIRRIKCSTVTVF